MSITPHNDLFLRAFGQPHHAAGMLRALLPAAALGRLDVDRLEVLPGTFVSPEFSTRHVDRLYVVPRIDGGDPAFVYVLYEHHSRDDRWMALRVLEYQVRIWDEHLRANPRARSLPVILPLVLAHTGRRWRAATHLHGLFDPALLAEPEIAELTPAFRYVLEELHLLTDDALLARELDAFARLVLQALRDARTGRLLRSLPAFHPLLDELIHSRTGRVDLESLVGTIFLVLGRHSFNDVIEHFTSPPVREAAMTIAEQLRKEVTGPGGSRGARKGSGR